MENAYLGNIIDLNGFDKTEHIGSGSYSNVFKIKSKSNNKFYAAKILKIKLNDNYIRFKRELYCLQTLISPSIIKYYGYSLVDFDGMNYPVFITKYMENGNLAQILRARSRGSRKFNNTKMIINILGISLGMKYIHEKQIVNRVLSPGNVLLDSNLYPKITDFDTTRIIDESTFNHITTSIDTLYYTAPEVYENDGYSFEVDVFFVWNDFI